MLRLSSAFKLGGMLNLKLKKKPATPARKGVNPFTKEPCVFKAKPASKTMRVLAMKKMKGPSIEKYCFQDCACVGHEEDEGGHQLNAVFGGFGRGYTELQFII